MCWESVAPESMTSNTAARASSPETLLTAELERFANGFASVRTLASRETDDLLASRLSCCRLASNEGIAIEPPSFDPAGFSAGAITWPVLLEKFEFVSLGVAITAGCRPALLKLEVASRFQPAGPEMTWNTSPAA